MRKRNGLVLIVLLPAALLLMLASGCGMQQAGPKKMDGLEQPIVRNTTAASTTVQQGDFTYRLYLERSEYKEGEAAAVTAELEYTGKQKSITIGHAASPFSFYFQDPSGSYSFIFAMDQPLIPMTLYPGEPFRETYTGAHAYLTDPDGEFPSELAPVPFPAGDYLATGAAEFSILDASGDSVGERIKLTAESGLQIKVTE